MTATPTAATPGELAAKLDALDDETMCFDGAATYALIGEAAIMIRALRAENERLTLERDEAIREIRSLTTERREMEDRATTAEAALAAMTVERDVARTKEDMLSDLLGEIAEALDVTNDSDKILAALSASQERERGMREALTGLADVVQRDCGVEPCAASMAPAERYLGMARNILAAKETTDGR